MTEDWAASFKPAIPAKSSKPESTILGLDVKLDVKLDIPFSKFKSPESIERYEKTQADIVSQIVQSDKKVIMLSAPTGIGKSIIGMMAGYQMADHVNYVCSDKQLQDQLVRDFPEAVVLKGRGNYVCNLFPHLNADTCLKRCDDYNKKLIPCNYYDQKEKLLKAKFRILNTFYLLFEINYAGQLSKQDLFIIDEADTLDNIMINFIGLGVHDGQIKKYDLGYPKITVVESWIEWAGNAIGILLRNYNPKYASNALDVEFIKANELRKKLELFLTLVEDDWIYNRNAQSSEFKPVWLEKVLADSYLFRHAKKFLLMSATLPPKQVYCETLCIDPLNCDYIEVGSVFKIENRVVKYIPTLDMSYKNKDNYWQMIDKVMALVDSHPNEKGIIHSQSYALNEKIMEQGNPRLITHNSKNKEAQLKIFMGSSEPLVFVSPSSTRGVSLDHDYARFNICLKIPFGNLKDKATSARLFGSGPRGQRWYNAEAAQTLLQLTGRTTRAYDDWSVTYILDKCFDRVRRLLPEWYRDAIFSDW